MRNRCQLGKYYRHRRFGLRIARKLKKSAKKDILRIWTADSACNLPIYPAGKYFGMGFWFENGKLYVERLRVA